MKRYRWNKRKFLKNISILIFMIIFSISVVGMIFIGLETESNIKLHETQTFLENIVKECN